MDTSIVVNHEVASLSQVFFWRYKKHLYFVTWDCWISRYVPVTKLKPDTSAKPLNAMEAIAMIGEAI